MPIELKVGIEEPELAVWMVIHRPFGELALDTHDAHRWAEPLHRRGNIEQQPGCHRAPGGFCLLSAASRQSVGVSLPSPASGQDLISTRRACHSRKRHR